MAPSLASQDLPPWDGFIMEKTALIFLFSTLKTYFLLPKYSRHLGEGEPWDTAEGALFSP